MPVTATELSYLREQPPGAKVEWYLALAPYGDPVFTARTNGTPSDDPNMTLPYDNGVGGVEAGMTLWVGSSARGRDVGVVRVRADASGASGNLDIAENYDIDWADDLYLTAPGEDGFRQLWSKYQRIADDGTVYKDYDIDYASAGDTGDPGDNIKPKANAGPPVCAWLEDDGEVEVEFDGTVSEVFGSGESISSYSWDFADGTPATSANSTETVTFDTTGFRYVELTVTCSNGETGVVYVPVWVFDEGVVDPITNFEVLDQSGSVDGGWSATLRAFEVDNDTVYDFPEGALAVVFTKTTYGDTEVDVGGYDERKNIRMVGWIGEDTLTFDYETGTVEFQVISHDQRLRNLFGLGFSLINSADPTAEDEDPWNFATNLNVDRAIQWHHEWHTTVNQVCHVESAGEGATRNFYHWKCAETNLYEQVQTELAEDANYFFLSDRQGVLRVTLDPQFIQVGSRDSAICTLDEDDWMNEVEADRRLPHAGYAKIGGFVSGGESADYARLSWAPGDAPKQAPDEINKEGFIIQDQDELNRWSGFMLAKENNPYPQVIVRLTGYWPVFDPALQEFVELTADDPLDKNDWANERFIVREVSFRDEVAQGTGVTELVLEMESSGPEGVTQDIPDLPEPEPPDWEPPPPPPPPTPPSWPEGAGMGIFLAGDFTYWFTENVTATPPFWTEVTISTNGDPIKLIYIQTGDDSVGGWMLSTTGVWYSDNILTDSPSWNGKLTISDTAAAGISGAQFVDIVVKSTNPDFVIVSYKHTSAADTTTETNGAIYSNDRGSSWTESTMSYKAYEHGGSHRPNVKTVGRLCVDEVSGSIYLIRGDEVWTSGLDTKVDISIFRSDDGGGTFNELAEIGRRSGSGGGLHTYGSYGFGSITVPLMASGTVYIASPHAHHNISKSTDSGATVAETASGIADTPRHLNSFTYDADLIWATYGDTTFYESDDAGGSWSNLNPTFNTSGVYHAIGHPEGWPGDELIRYAHLQASSGGRTLVASFDGGSTWHDMTGPAAGGGGTLPGTGASTALVIPPRIGANAE